MSLFQASQQSVVDPFQSDVRFEPTCRCITCITGLVESGESVLPPVHGRGHPNVILEHRGKQLACMQTGAEIFIPKEEKTEEWHEGYHNNPWWEYDGNREWPALLRKLHRENPGFDI